MSSKADTTAAPGPKVSIGLPCYNAEATVAESVESIREQTLADWELIAIDDGSTDGTRAVLASFDDPRIRLLSDGTNRGRCARLNQIAETARGRYLARMDADDIMLPERLEKQAGFLQAHPDIDLLGGGLVSIDASGTARGMQLAPGFVDDPWRIFRGEVLYHPTVMARTEWFRNHPYIEGYVYSDDFALWAKYAGELTIANLQEPLIKYREHELFTYAKYRGRSRETLRALHEFGPRWLTAGQLRALVLRRHLKDWVYRLLKYAGLWRHTYRLSRQTC
jgi:glycosyltransferase involved in cell wall biosynthesis